MTSNLTNATYELSSPPSEEKTPTQHAETVEKAESKEIPVKIEYTERNTGLRIDGDDFDHEHEPKVVYLKWQKKRSFS